MTKAVLSSLLLLIARIAYSQCPSVDFSIPATACLNTNFEPSAVISNAASYSWDFCDGSLLNTPELKVNTLPVGLTDIYDLTHVEHNGNHFSFAVSYAANRIYRFDHGMNIASTPQQVTDLGDLGILRPLGIYFIEESSIFFALVVTESGKLYRLSFGASPGSIPTVAEITGMTGLTDHRQMKIFKENGSVLALIAGGNTTKVSLLNFGNSIGNQPTQSFIQLPTGNIVMGLDVITECNNSYSLVSTLGDGIYLLSFGTSFTNAPVITKPVNGGSRLGLSIVKSKGQFYAFVSTQPGGIDRFDFGNSITNTPSVVNLGTFGGISLAIGHSIVKVGARYYDISINNSNGRYRILEFPKACDYGGDYLNLENPGFIKYNSAGTYFITLAARGSNNELVTVTKSVVVSSVPAPVPDVIASHQCQTSGITFTSTTQSGETITSAQWTFGDSTPSATELNPIHQFATAGEYTVKLEITVINNCKNIVEENIRIYDPPIADFLMPSGLICTNNQFTFLNNTADVFDGYLSYQWYVDNNPVGTARDLQHTFLSTGVKTIKLKTSIPGCFSEVTQSTSAIQAGPTVDFLVAGKCIGEEIQFTSNISETVTDYAWNFGDGNTSTQTNPKNIFANAGEFSVSLATTSPNGCNNSINKQITIFSKPAVDFSTDSPPQSCSGSATRFNNLTPGPTDGTIASWLWDFGDPGTNNTSTLQEPSHIFANAGTYDVALTAVTEDGCLGSIQKSIGISQSPAVTVENNAPCIGLPVNFTATGNNIQTYYWEIGTSYYTTANTSHTFNAPGTYPVRLTVQGSNGCQFVFNKNVSVPVPLIPDFTVTKNCTDHQTVFTDITAGADAVVQRSWDFAGIGAGTGSQALFQFNALGNKSVKLTVTSQAACTYSKTRLVNIIRPPVAGFIASPETGALPLTVQFTNTSTDAVQYEWNFGDAGAMSSAVSPAYIFQNIGTFVTSLKATNNEGCESLFSKPVNVAEPRPDVDLKVISIAENPDGTINVIVTIQNKGNTILKNLPVDIDISGKVSLREIIEEPIAPSSLYNLVLNYGINYWSNLGFLCATTTLLNDLAPEGNRICTELNDNIHFFSPYPNPVKSELFIEWIAPGEKAVEITIIDTFGKTISSTLFSSLPGLNRSSYDVRNLQTGIYIVRFNAGAISKSQRIFVSREN